MKCLRIVLEMPQAHFRKPWSFSIRHTYPIPPFSTVIGLLCNALGNGEELFKNTIGLSIFSKFDAVDCEYTWLRNLSPKAHQKKYHSKFSRQLSINNIEHPGGQSPVRMFILNNCETIIYIASEDMSFLNAIKDSFHNPRQWYSHLHLGRSEDWINLKGIKNLDLQTKNFAGKTDYLTWIPSNSEMFTPEHSDIKNDYIDLYGEFKGRSMIIPGKYEMVKISGENLRNFEWKKVKLLESQTYPISLTSKIYQYYFDEEKNLPIIFTKIGGDENTTREEQTA